MRYSRNSTKTHQLLASVLFLASLHAVGIPADAVGIPADAVGIPTVAGIPDVASAAVHLTIANVLVVSSCCCYCP